MSGGGGDSPTPWFLGLLSSFQLTQAADPQVIQTKTITGHLRMLPGMLRTFPCPLRTFTQALRTFTQALPTPSGPRETRAPGVSLRLRTFADIASDIRAAGGTPIESGFRTFRTFRTFLFLKKKRIRIGGGKRGGRGRVRGTCIANVRNVRNVRSSLESSVQTWPYRPRGIALIWGLGWVRRLSDGKKARAHALASGAKGRPPIPAGSTRTRLRGPLVGHSAAARPRPQPPNPHQRPRGGAQDPARLTHKNLPHKTLERSPYQGSTLNPDVRDTHSTVRLTGRGDTPERIAALVVDDEDRLESGIGNGGVAEGP